MNIYVFDKTNNNILLLLELLKKDYSLELTENNIIYGKNKKPKIDKCNICFNMSHTANILVIAVSYVEVGVDIEKIIKQKLIISNRIFTKNEIACLNRYNTEFVYYYLWTRKEAYIKKLSETVFYVFNKVDILKEKFIFSFSFKINNELFMLSVASNDDSIHIFDKRKNSDKKEEIKCKLINII